MVREIVHCQVGQCGNQIGNAFWVTMLAEHHLAQGDGKFETTKDPVRDQQNKIDRGMKMLGGKCTLGVDC